LISVIIARRHCEIAFNILPLGEVDILLGLDWFSKFNAWINPTQGLIVFPTEKINMLSKSKSTNRELVEEIEEELDQTCFMIEENDDELQEHTNWDDDLVEHEIKFESKMTEKQEEKAIKLIPLIRKSYATSYADIGRCKVGTHKIRMICDKPIFTYPYRKSEKENVKINDETQKMLKANIIRISRSSWSSPITPVAKNDGGTRLCIDFRKINKLVEPDRFPMQRIDDILDRLQAAKIFSKIDLKSGYWQIKLDPESIPKTAFSTRDGHYEFLVLPFGLKNASAEFNRTMQQILGDLNFVQIYIDDITIHSKSIEDHIEHIKTVLKRIKEAGLELNGQKCV